MRGACSLNRWHLAGAQLLSAGGNVCIAPVTHKHMCSYDVVKSRYCMVEMHGCNMILQVLHLQELMVCTVVWLFKLGLCHRLQVLGLLCYSLGRRADPRF